MNLPTKQADGNGRFHEYVVDNIRQVTVDGKFQVGQKLSSEQELAEKFNVNRVLIRGVLKILEYVGVLDSSPGDGTYVKNTPVQSLASKMDFSFDAMADTTRDLLELHIVLETFTTHHAAQRHTGEDIASIQKLFRGMREAKKISGGTERSAQNPRKFSHDFHQALVRAAHNAMLSGVYEYFYKLLDISQQFTINNSGISYSSIMACKALFSKVIEGDAEGARQCTEEHMEDVRYNLKSTMGTDHPGQKVAFG